MPYNIRQWILPLCVVALVACGDAAQNPGLPDGSVDAPIGPGLEVAPPFDGPVAPVDSGTRGLSGLVTDQAGVPVVGAQVTAGGGPSDGAVTAAVSVYSDGQGLYTIAGLPAGPIAVTVTREYFQPAQLIAGVQEVGQTRFDITLQELPLKLDPADVALAAAYNQTFDWTKQTLSIAIAPTATRRNFDNAVYWRNPALYRDTSTQPLLAPSPLPAITGGVAAGFTFPIRGGSYDGKEALVLATVVDSLATTPVAAAEPTDYMLWTPMLNWLTDWSPAKAADLKMVGVAVRQQSWGSTAQRPQDLGRVYVDAANAALWVEVVFAKFVQVGEGITDDDGDGYKEVFARIDGTFVSQEILDVLVQYRQTRYTTHAMSKEVIKALREIYSATSAQVERTMGQPYEIPGVGTIVYPFVVLKHAAGQVNVILVGP